MEGSGQEPRSLLSLGGSYKTMASSLSQDLIHGMAHLCPPNDLAVVLGHKHILPPRLRQLPNRIATCHTPFLYASSPLKATSLFSKWRPYTSRRTAPIHILHALSSGMPHGPSNVALWVWYGPLLRSLSRIPTQVPHWRFDKPVITNSLHSYGFMRTPDVPNQCPCRNS